MGRIGKNVTSSIAFLGFYVVLKLKSIGCLHDIILLFHNFQSLTGRSHKHVLFIIFDEFVTSVIKGLALALIFRYIKAFGKFPI